MTRTAALRSLLAALTLSACASASPVDALLDESRRLYEIGALDGCAARLREAAALAPADALELRLTIAERMFKDAGDLVAAAALLDAIEARARDDDDATRRRVAELRAAMVPGPRATVIACLSVGDRDADGYDDATDNCPDEPERFNGFEDDDGCPDADPEPQASRGRALRRYERAGALPEDILARLRRRGKA
ncbi:MAG: hypothetical protein H6713_25760 [Myxococcales bacterium]|nr:hypothetical protein [Myxococcales bacterium]